jgi:hypothetical protein
MQMIPHGKQEWLRFVVFPFKAYAFIAPALLFIIAASFPRSRHSGHPDAAALLLALLLPCSLILLFAAFLFALFGPKGHALPCLGFAAGEIIFFFLFLPTLAVA